MPCRQLALKACHFAFQSPHQASLVQSLLTVIVMGIFMAVGADPFRQLLFWLVGLGTLAVLVLQTATAVAVIAFFRRRTHDGRLWQTLVAPLLSALGLGSGTVLAIGNFDIITGITGGPASLLPWLIPVAGLLSLAAAAYASLRGRVVRLTAPTTASPTTTAPEAAGTRTTS